MQPESRMYKSLTNRFNIMNAERLNALIREIREEAKTLPAGKRRDVNNKLERIELNFRRAGKSVPVTTPTEEEAEHFASQVKTIYNYLLAGNTLTSLDALRIFGVARLASRICDITKQTGITPNRKRIQVTNRHGKEVWVNEYWIEKEEAQ